MECFLPNIKKRMMSTLIISVQDSIGDCSQCSRQKRKKKNSIHIGKEEVKLSLFTDDMVM